MCGFRVAAGLLAILSPLVSKGASAFLPGDEYQVTADVSLLPDVTNLDFISGSTSIYSFEDGSFTDFLLQNRMNQDYVYLNGWGAFPDLDYLISATNLDGESMQALHQNSGDVVLQETVGTPAVFHQTALDPNNGFSTVHSFQFPQGNKRVTLLQGTNGGFLVSETVSNVTRIALFDETGSFVKEWATENYRFVTGPNIAAFVDGSVVISGAVEPLIQTTGLGGQTNDVIAKLRAAARAINPHMDEGWANFSGFSSPAYATFLPRTGLEEVKDPLGGPDGLLGYSVAIGSLAPDTCCLGWVDDNLATIHELAFPGLKENDPSLDPYFNLIVSAGKGNEIVFPARMDDPSGGPSFLMLNRLDLDTGDMLESVGCQLDQDYTFDRLEYRGGQIFGQLFGGGNYLLLKCDPLNLAGLLIYQLTNTSGRANFNIPDDTSQPLDATWSNPGTSAHNVAAFDDNVDDTLCLQFAHISTGLFVSTPTVNDPGPVATTNADVLVEQTNPQWDKLLQPNDRPVTVTPASVNLTQTCEALRLVGDLDGTGGFRIHFASVTGYDYQLRGAAGLTGLLSPGAVMETIPGTGSNIVRTFQVKDRLWFYAAAAIKTP